MKAITLDMVGASVRGAAAKRAAPKPAAKRAPARRKNPAPPSPLFAIQLNAGNGSNGNSRSGWVVCELTNGSDIKHLGFVVAGYAGVKELHRAYGNIPTTGVFSIPPKEFAELKRRGESWIVRNPHYFGA